MVSLYLCMCLIMREEASAYAVVSWVIFVEVTACQAFDVGCFAMKLGFNVYKKGYKIKK